MRKKVNKLIVLCMVAFLTVSGSVGAYTDRVRAEEGFDAYPERTTDDPDEAPTEGYDEIDDADVEIMTMTDASEEDASDVDDENYGAQKYVEGDFVYITDNGCTIVEYTGNASNLVIPDTLGGYDVKAIGAECFMNNTTLRRVKLGTEIFQIGARAFKGCTNLTEVILSPNLRIVRYSAFVDCTSLKTIELPASLCSENGETLSDGDVANGIFTGCSSLSTVTFAKGCKVIPAYLFHNCNGIKSIKIPDSVTKIKKSAFYNCNNLTYVDMGRGVTIIDSGFYNRTFAKCDKLATIIFSPKLSNVGDYAFSSNPSLEKVSLPASLCSGDKKGKLIFTDCDKLKSISFAKGSKFIPATMFTNCDSLEVVTIPDSVTEIQHEAFKNCDGLTTLNMGNGVTKVDYDSFKSCDKLISIKFSPKLTCLGGGAFAGCGLLTKVNLPKGLLQKKNGYFSAPFKGDLNLKTVVIPEGSTYINGGIFMNTGLKSVTLPSTIVGIGESAFEDCDNLKSIKLGYNVEKIEKRAFADCDALEKVYIYNEIISFYDKGNVFKDSPNVTIYSYKGSEAEAYAKKYNIPFVAINKTTVLMYRMYNPNSGEHFYTSNKKEIDTLVKAGWANEGKAWRAPIKSKTPVYRLYNPNSGDHHYTTSASEKNKLVNAGWKYEGIGWYSDDKKGIPLYRLYNPNASAGSHHYTTSTAEKNNLVKSGWKYEGIAWYGIK